MFWGVATKYLQNYMDRFKVMEAVLKPRRPSETV